jgi:hypothetical protein
MLTGCTAAIDGTVKSCIGHFRCFNAWYHIAVVAFFEFAAVFNDGREVNMLCLSGTIPTVFQGVTYQTPVKIWLTPSFPYEPPLCFINPTSG